MKLYEVPRNTTIIIVENKVTVPPDSLEIKKGDILKFSHTGGMYSYCEDKYGNIVHPAAWTEVENKGG